MRIKFQPGQIVATPEALAALRACGKSVHELLCRHLSGDWGDVCEEDRRLNDVAVLDGGRLLSSYEIDDDLTIWLITEGTDDSGERISTTALLPSQY